MNYRLSALIVALSLFLPDCSLATVHHVPVDYPTIQAGINAAVDGDVVLVADGTYSGDGNRDISFQGKAIQVLSQNGPQATIIDCQGESRGVRFDVFEGRNSEIAGFTIVNGYAEGPGAGIYCSMAQPTISNCEIRACTSMEGGGLYIEGGAPLIVNCVIEGNHGGGLGGGVSAREASPVFSGCMIRNNVIESYGDSVFGGGVFSLDSTMVFNHCTIGANEAYGGTGSNAFGGGACFWGSGGAPHQLNNCLIAGNAAVKGWNTTSCGGGIFCDRAAVRVTGCTLTGNSDDSTGAAVYAGSSCDMRIVNSIIWDNSPREVHGPITVTFSDVRGGYSGQGNIDADPCFTFGPLGTYYLNQLTSVCVDAGDPGYLPSKLRTTSSNHAWDAWPLDIGYHYSAALFAMVHGDVIYERDICGNRLIGPRRALRRQ